MHRLLLYAATLALACAPGRKDGPRDLPSGGDPADTGAEVAWPDAEVEDLGPSSASDASDLFFADESLHTIDITLSDDARNALRREPYEYVEGGVIIDGLDVGVVGVRIKGKYGSYRSLRGKPSLKFDFNRFQDGRRFLGLEKLNLNNAITDCSYLHDRVAYRLFGDAGLPTLRTSYAQVTVNGDEYGLYVLIEAPDDRFLARNFEDDSGNLYDGKYYLSDDWSSYAMVDFDPVGQEYFLLDEGTDVGLADIYAVTDAALAAAEDGEAYAGLEGLVNWPVVLRHWAAEQWIGQNDGYVLNQNNYFVYFDPTDGRLQMIPWDLDYSFLAARDWGFSWRRPSGVLADLCLDDELCEAAWQEQVAVLLDTVDPDALTAFAETLQDVSEGPAAADPRAECTSRSMDSAREHVFDWLVDRSEDLAGTWDL